jgi:hypothetical protein
MKKEKKTKKKAEPKRQIKQNGKGSAPRNLSEQFKKNYDTINWKNKN